jgi:hypothetical protein
VCESRSRRLLSVREQVRIRECPSCGHRFAELQPAANHVSTVYDDSYFFGGGAGYPDYLSEGRLLRAHGARYARLIRRYVSPPGRMLDVGAACGFLCDGFRSAGWETEALEPNGRMARYGRETLGLTTHETALEEFNGQGAYDLVSMIQVIAHFVDLHKAMAKAAELTRDGGFWLIETWDHRSLTARAFGKHWHEYNPPSVLNYFSRRSLGALGRQLGFHLVAEGRPRKRILWRHARSLLDHQVPWGWFHRVSGVLPDDLMLPYPAEDLFWVLLRKGG